MGTLAVGIDACRGGWVAVTLASDGSTRALRAATRAEVGECLPDAGGLAVDMPIGLPVAGVRAADLAARKVLGPRWASVFLTPVRQALVATSHAEATAVSRDLAGRGVSQQAYALAPKMLEVERWLPTVGRPVWEVHPEVSFTVMAGRPAGAGKKTWAGMRERLAALRRGGVRLSDLGEAGTRVAVDDVLDAAAAAWSAARLLRGEAVSFPDPPEVDARTRRQVAIWA